MLHGDLMGFALYLAYFLAAALAALLVKWWLGPPFEVVRKALHLIVAMSIFPLVHLFDAWYMAVVAAALLVLIAYPLLALAEGSALFERFAVERTGGEFKKSLVLVQVTLMALIVVFWGLLGPGSKYIAVVAVMAWGFGDAAAALVGKSLGRRRIRHRRIEGAKTMEGTFAMLVVAGLALFLTLFVYADASLNLSLAVALLVAPVCAGVELFSHRGMDTLTVPITTGIGVVSALTFLSFLGV